MDTPSERPSPGGGGRGEAPRRAPEAGAPLRVYKPGQGQHVRWSSAVAAGVIVVATGWFVHDQLVYAGAMAQKLIALGVVAALGVLVYYALGRNHSTVDFMIATEGEMKKVNWTTRREIIGATKVVIVAMFALAFLLFAVDIFFMVIFSSIDVLQIDIGQVFGGGGE